ncbi:UNVERIFIED_CONTAM: hypothetical protein NCL1_35790 [Trichonephila clavipes]
MRKIRTLCHFSTELIEFSCSLGGRSCIMIVKRRPSAGADEDNWSSLQRVDSCCISGKAIGKEHGALVLATLSEF